MAVQRPRAGTSEVREAVPAPRPGKGECEWHRSHLEGSLAGMGDGWNRTKTLELDKAGGETGYMSSWPREGAQESVSCREDLTMLAGARGSYRDHCCILLAGERSWGEVANGPHR